ncbi:tyrosine phosphatase family-domain-containing protein [Endogone sp. FLAS-F59071]|nr:tyrosine phosphatase family-domain-containing protein [Endogone sp. FLAS-F59071]|eukprot:RUS21121.1 tyrosine phosphatase family-domain-containing protein [Endogone sp. FLAS-F59071]
MPPFLFTPPEQFGIVEKGVYRSDMLQASHLPFIKQLHLKTVLVLSPELPTRPGLNFFEENNIKLIHLGFATWKPTQPPSWRPVSDELIKEGLELVLDYSIYPVLVMCTSGIHETGTFFGCLRRLQNWNFTSIVMEYRSYASNKGRYMNEQFIELYDLDLVTLPPNLPPWFVEQQRLLKEEETEYKQNLERHQRESSTA